MRLGPFSHQGGRRLLCEPLKVAVLANSAAIGNTNGKGMIPLADFEAIGAAIGYMVASVTKRPSFATAFASVASSSSSSGSLCFGLTAVLVDGKHVLGITAILTCLGVRE